MKVRGFAGRTRVWRLILSGLSILGLLAGLVAFTVQMSGASAGATLNASKFESGDANLVVDSSGNNDWATDTSTATSPAPNFVGAQDLASGSGDNAFGQGAKEDIPCPSVVSGSIPPNKSDLSRFYTSWELGSDNHYYLYLAWERSNVLGNANMDFEFQQDGSQCSNGTTFTRTAGDRLVTYDFPGSGSPDLGLLTWVTGTTTPVVSGWSGNNACFSANSFPCWGDRTDLSTAGEANGAVNSAPVTDPLTFSGSSAAPGSLAAGTFGEAGIDLTAAGVLSPGGPCTFLGSAQLNSRSSSSFTSEVKDFIAPVPVSISNCGTVKIEKQFSTATAPSTPATFELHHDADQGSDAYSLASDLLYSYPTTTKLASAVTTTTATSISVANAGVFTGAAPFYIKVGTEFMKVTGVSSNTLTVQRGKDNSTAATHLANDTVTQVAICDAATFNSTDNAYECTLTNLPFAKYWAVESVVPTGYTGAGPTAVTITATAGNGVVGPVTNTANPTDVVIHKRDDKSPTPNPVPLCTTGTTGCAKFQLFNSSASSTLSGAIAKNATTIGVVDGSSFPASNFYVLIDSEIIHIASRSGNTLTADAWGQYTTTAASHSATHGVNALAHVADCVEATGQTAAGGDCTFQQVNPGSYWIVEVIAPAGYAPDPNLPKAITVTVNDTTADQTYTFVNTRLFKVLVFVCQESNNQLYASTVGLDGASVTSNAHGDSIGGISESTLCGLTGGAVFPDKTANASGTSYSGSVSIPN